jgi:hypothetical protein
VAGKHGFPADAPIWLLKINPQFVIIFDYIVRLTMGIAKAYTITIIAISLQSLAIQARRFYA